MARYTAIVILDGGQYGYIVLDYPFYSSFASIRLQDMHRYGYSLYLSSELDGHPLASSDKLKPAHD